jgi:hypothetical protein
VTLSPKKCKFGYKSIEYVGITLTPEGFTFSKQKRSKVLDFPPPQTAKDLLSFLGLCNYIRAHVSDMAKYEIPLRTLIKSQRLNWTPELEEIFFTLRDIVGNCPQLHYFDSKAPLYVMTDASDYGIGAYFYQVIYGVEKPIKFESVSLHGAQLRWSVIEKEGYGIFYAIIHNEHLLGGRHFVLKTDHRNLTFINSEGSPKVYRWKLRLQEFDFDLEYVKEEDNSIADITSRQCPKLGDSFVGEYDLKKGQNPVLL